MKTDQLLHSKIIEAAGGLLWRVGYNCREIAVVHRSRHQDWSLPKGKKDRGESWQETALREVLEETGYQAQLEAYAGCTTYLVNGVPKVVLFWHMSPITNESLVPCDEIDQIVWFSRDEAIKMISYSNEKELLTRLNNLDT